MSTRYRLSESTLRASVMHRDNTTARHPDTEHVITMPRRASLIGYTRDDVRELHGYSAVAALSDDPDLLKRIRTALTRDQHSKIDYLKNLMCDIGHTPATPCTRENRAGMISIASLLTGIIMLIFGAPIGFLLHPALGYTVLAVVAIAIAVAHGSKAVTDQLHMWSWSWRTRHARQALGYLDAPVRVLNLGPLTPALQNIIALHRRLGGLEMELLRGETLHPIAEQAVRNELDDLWNDYEAMTSVMVHTLAPVAHASTRSGAEQEVLAEVAETLSHRLDEIIELIAESRQVQNQVETDIAAGATEEAVTTARTQLRRILET